MLGREHNGRHTHRLVTLVGDRYLRLAVGAQVGEGAMLAYLGEAMRQPVREGDGQGHQLVRLVAGVAEHDPLVAGAGEVEVVVALGLSRLVYALSDVGRLLVEDRKSTRLNSS